MTSLTEVPGEPTGGAVTGSAGSLSDQLDGAHVAVVGLGRTGRAVAEALSKGSMFSVIGGGDSAAAVRLLGFDENTFSHISTGGGASLELLEGKVLPGIAVLED